MPARKLLLLTFAAIIGLGTVFMVRSMMTPEQQAPAPEPQIKNIEIIAAAHNLSTGTIIKDMDLKWIPWSAEAENSKFFIKGKANTTDLVGAVVREGITGDEPVLTSRVVQPHEQGFLAAVLKPGMRAMSVSLTPSAEVAGFIFPGDRVDVILTNTFSRKDVTDLTERRVSETVLEDVRVLALDQRSDNQSNDPKVAQIATLEVSPKQAEKLALASDLSGQATGNKGSISLALRSLASEEPSKDGTAKPAGKDTSPTWDSDVSHGFPTVNGEDGLMQRVQIMRGKTTTETIYERRK
jgi:pilus assembly protein CpaB